MWAHVIKGHAEREVISRGHDAIGCHLPRSTPKQNRALNDLCFFSGSTPVCNFSSCCITAKISFSWTFSPAVHGFVFKYTFISFVLISKYLEAILTADRPPRIDHYVNIRIKTKTFSIFFGCFFLFFFWEAKSLKISQPVNVFNMCSKKGNICFQNGVHAWIKRHS